MASLDDNMRAEIRRQLVGATPPKSARAGRKGGWAGGWARPYASDALGVSPEQIPEATAHLRSHGITANFDADGCCLITSSKQFQDVAKATGMKDGRDGYEVRNVDGIKMLTGNRHIQEREAFKRQLRRAIDKGESF